MTAMRSPAEVMTPSRLGCFMPTRLSFAHALIRRLISGDWRLQKTLMQVDAQGVGFGCLTMQTGAHVFSLVAFSDNIAADKRCDRVIAEQWDAVFVLLQGEATHADIQRLRAQAPRQEAGRYCARDLVISRANRSVRLFEKVADCLAAGRQPPADEILRVGYLARTTAVYGNGKFGCADLSRVRRLPLPPPFCAEMLTVWLIRHWTVEWVQAMARQRNPDSAAKLSPPLRRQLGVGNSTGLGMAPFLIHHPKLLHCWTAARETAIARVVSQPAADKTALHKIGELLTRATRHLAQWRTDDERQAKTNQRTTADLQRLSRRAEKLPRDYPWRHLQQWAAKNTCGQTQEFLHSILLEPHGEIIDDLSSEMDAPDDDFIGAPWRSLSSLRAELDEHYDWVAPGGAPYCWYRSADKEEPRRGRRRAGRTEIRIGIGKEILPLKEFLAAADEEFLARTTVAEFALSRPQWRGMMRRAQATAKFPYGEVRADILSASCSPLSLLRAKLSFLGAYKYDPQSDLWLRINLFQGAPYADELHCADADDWAFAAF